MSPAQCMSVVRSFLSTPRGCCVPPVGGTQHPLVHLVILWRSSTKAYICRRHCLHLLKTLQPAHEQTPPISNSHVRLLISFNTHQELNEKLIVQPEKDAPAKLTGCWGALLAVGLSSRSSSSGDASAMALSTSSMTSSSRTAAVLFRCIFEWRL